jgi:hypothetical protein
MLSGVNKRVKSLRLPLTRRSTRNTSPEIDKLGKEGWVVKDDQGEIFMSEHFHEGDYD